MSKESRIFDLEDRFIDFAIHIIRTAEASPKIKNFMIRNFLFDIRYSIHL
jgi:hypothetical protein